MKKTPAKKRYAYSYIRMSTDTQGKGHSIKRQLELAEKYAKENDFILKSDFEEEKGRSAYHGKHIAVGKLGAFLEALKNQEIDPDSVLIVESLDRLSRQDALQAFQQFTTFLNYGIEVHTLSDGQKYTREPLHDRTPVILEDDNDWLVHGGTKQLRSPREGLLTHREVNRAVNKATIKDIESIGGYRFHTSTILN